MNQKHKSEHKSVTKSILEKGPVRGPVEGPVKMFDGALKIINNLGQPDGYFEISGRADRQLQKLY